jgi:SAM-dependent methyltransferase
MPDALFWEVHSGLAREGPGDEASLRRALAMMKTLPAAPDILDVGCGPGAQSLALASLTAGTIAAVDAHAPFLAVLNRAAAERGLADRITTVEASMAAMPFDDASFDAIWCEGAIYNIGLGRGLSAWKRFLRPGGYVAVTEPCWLAPIDEIPAGALALWADYPAMTGVEAILGIAAGRLVELLRTDAGSHHPAPRSLPRRSRGPRGVGAASGRDRRISSVRRLLQLPLRRDAGALRRLHQTSSR